MSTLGMLAGIVGFGLYVPEIGIFIAIFSVLFLSVWDVLIARRLFALGRLEDDVTAN